MTLLSANLVLAFLAPFEMTILHTNDMHSHIEPVIIRGKSYGGYARQATLIKRYRAHDKNVVLLNGGDTFQGTLYFHVYEGLADLAFMNHVRYDAAAVGNHEFDRGPKTFSEFVKRASFPVLAANLNVAGDPDLKHLIQPYVVLKVGKESVGIIGAVTPDLPTISNIGTTVQMIDLGAGISASLRELSAKKVNKIILVSHLGYDLEKKIAAEFPQIDVIVGGHSHSFLADANFKAPEGWPKAEGPYPTIVAHKDKSMTLVVQGWEWSKALGRLKVQFDRAGKVSGFREASPIVIDSSVPEDPEVAHLVSAFQKPVLAAMNQRVGETEVNLDRSGLMRELIPDAMLPAVKSQNVAAAFVNVGGVRSGIEKGPMTLGKLNEVQPFRNQIMILELTGQQIIDAIDSTVRDGGTTGGLLLPSSGTSYRLDVSKPAKQRVSEFIINGAPVKPDTKYRLAFPNFTANGGDSHEVLRDSKGYRYDTGIVDIDALIEFVRDSSPIRRQSEGRVVIVGR